MILLALVAVIGSVVVAGLLAKQRFKHKDRRPRTAEQESWRDRLADRMDHGDAGFFSRRVYDAVRAFEICKAFCIPAVDSELPVDQLPHCGQ